MPFTTAFYHVLMQRECITGEFAMPPTFLLLGSADGLCADREVCSDLRPELFFMNTTKWID